MKTPCIVVIIGALLLISLMLQNETQGAEKDVSIGHAPQKCSLAVLEFTFERNYRGVPHEFETSLLRDKLITALVKTRKFNVVERARLDKVLDEQQFSDSGLVSKEHAVNLGRMLAADYLVMGSISVVKVESHIEKIPYVSRYNRTHEGIIIVDMRIVETEKGRIVAAEKGETKLKDEEMKDTQYIDPVPPEFYDRLLRKLVDSLTQSIIDAVYPVKIVKIDGDTVYLNRGEGGGLRPQQQLTVFMLGKEIVDPDTHESLGFAEKEIGLLKVTEVLQKMTKAKILEQSNGISVGSICRKSDKKKRETTQETDSRKKPELAF